MLREPYNMNPYNSTIDTSLADGNEFSFYFSGDRLGKYAFEIKENNTEGILYQSDVYSADNVYDGSKVDYNINLSAETSLLGKNLVWRTILYEQTNSADEQESANQAINYVSSNQIIASTLGLHMLDSVNLYAEIGINPSYINTHTSSNSSPFSSITRNCWVDDTAQYSLTRVDSSNYTFTIPKTYVRDNVDLVAKKNSFVVSNVTSSIDAFIVIDNNYYAILDCTSDTTNFYLALRRFMSQGTIKVGYYGYELICKEGKSLGSNDDTVTYYYYDQSIIPDAQWKMISSSGSQKVLDGYGSSVAIVPYIHAIYSTGLERGYLTDDELSGFGVGSTYSLYNNFYISNWTYFESRKNPNVVLQYIHPINHTRQNLINLDSLLDPYTFRSIKLSAEYTQINNIAPRYYQWTVTQKGKIIDQSDEIYNASLDYEFAPFTISSCEKQDTQQYIAIDEPYVFTLKIVNQAGVVVEKSGNVQTAFTNTNYLGTSSCTINEDEHYATITWENALSAAPTEDSLNSLGEVAYRNDIDIGDHYNIQLAGNNYLQYNSIGGDYFSETFSNNDYTFRTGFVIGDKVDNKLTYYSRDLIILENSIILNKNRMRMTLKNPVNKQDFSPNWDLLTPTTGLMLDNYIDSHHLGEDMVWEAVVTDTNIWDDDKKWYETTSDTTCYYYELVVDKISNSTQHRAKVYRYVYQRGNNTTNANSIIIPYNNLLVDNNTSRKWYYKTSNTSAPLEITISTITGDTNNLQITSEPIDSISPPLSIGEYVIYCDYPDEFSIANFNIPNNAINSVTYNPFLYLYYTEMQDEATTLTPLGFGIKPKWDNTEPKVKDPHTQFVLTFVHKSLYSSFMLEVQGAGEGVVTDYEVWRWKFRTKEDAENDINPIYTRYLGTINLQSEDLAAAGALSFTDYTIENNGWYYYHIIPLGIADQAIYKSNWDPKNQKEYPIHANWYGWSFTSFIPDHNHYKPIEHWVYYLNLESNGYTHVVDKVIDQGFYRYPRISVGQTNYITSQLTGLIGEFKQTLVHRGDNSTWNDYRDDNMERILRWENFISNGNLILVKDYKGRAYIASLDSGSIKFTDIATNILSTVSFNITQLEDDANFAIFKVEEIS